MKYLTGVRDKVHRIKLWFCNSITCWRTQTSNNIPLKWNPWLCTSISWVPPRPIPHSPTDRQRKHDFFCEGKYSVCCLPNVTICCFSLLVVLETEHSRTVGLDKVRSDTETGKTEHQRLWHPRFHRHHNIPDQTGERNWWRIVRLLSRVPDSYGMGKCLRWCSALWNISGWQHSWRENVYIWSTLHSPSNLNKGMKALPEHLCVNVFVFKYPWTLQFDSLSLVLSPKVFYRVYWRYRIISCRSDVFFTLSKLLLSFNMIIHLQINHIVSI